MRREFAAWPNTPKAADNADLPKERRVRYSLPEELRYWRNCLADRGHYAGWATKPHPVAASSPVAARLTLCLPQAVLLLQQLHKLRLQGRKLRLQGRKLRPQGRKLRPQGRKLRPQGRKLRFGFQLFLHLCNLVLQLHNLVLQLCNLALYPCNPVHTC